MSAGVDSEAAGKPTVLEMVTLRGRRGALAADLCFG